MRYRPDIVHYPITAHWNLEKSLAFLTISKAFGCKTIGHLHDGRFDNYWDSVSGPRKTLALHLFEKLDHMIVLSEYWKRYVERKVPVKHVDVVHNIIDKQFEESMRKTTYSKNGNLLFVGTIGKLKGVYDIVEAIHKIRKSLEVRVELVGPGRNKKHLKSIKRLIEKYELSDYVIMKGPLYGVNKIEAFKNASIFLLPSHNENFPLVILEAACTGLPIITTRVGGIPDFFEHEKSVYFIEPGNIKQIAQTIVQLLHNEEKREALGEEARKIFISRFSRENILESLDNVYQKVYC
jgi:glycosyltransferase involved in cell wall biosynthesis